MARPRPGRLLTLLGVFALVVGLIGAVALVFASTQRRVNAVEGLARAPVGCDTTLDFAETGEYFVFVERAGSIDAVRGDCGADGDFSVDGGIDVVIEVVDPDGVSVELDRVIGSVDYDVSGFVGEAAFTIDVVETGDHVMRVESDDGFFVAAVGPDPSDGSAGFFVGAAFAGVLGLVVGVGLILAGRSRRTREVFAMSAPVAPGVPFSPVGQVPQGPPTYTQPGGPVQYGQPPAAPASTPPVYGGSVPAPTRPPTAPGSMPRYEPPAPPSAPPTPGPQIPGEPTWVAPGGQPPPPPSPPPPQQAAASDPWMQPPPPPAAPRQSPPPPEPERFDVDATIRRDDIAPTPPPPAPGSVDADDHDDTPTVERPRWEGPPPS